MRKTLLALTAALCLAGCGGNDITGPSVVPTSTPAPAVHISGHVYGVTGTVGYKPLSSATVTGTGGGPTVYAYTDTTGGYVLPAMKGNATITVKVHASGYADGSVSGWYTVSQTPYSLDFFLHY